MKAVNNSELNGMHLDEAPISGNEACLYIQLHCFIKGYYKVIILLSSLILCRDGGRIS